MSKILTIALLVLGGLVAFGGTSEARGPRRWRAASTPNVAQSIDGGYRTYSYEPGLTPGASPRYSSPESRPFSGFHSAGWKITGR
jgi:hypothetical protein